MSGLDRRTTIAIVTHVLSTGPADALETYAGTRAGRVVFIGHSFADARIYRSFVRRREAGALSGEQVVPWSRRVPGPVTWVKDVVLTVWWGLRTPGTIDIFVGADSLNALAGLILRRLGKVRRVVFWTIDYVPTRFESELLNRLYHSLDRRCVRACDETWNLSSRMEEARCELGVTGRQRIVPMGAWLQESTGEVDRDRIVFLGHLLEKQGVQLLLRALPRVREQIPGATLLVLGEGAYRPALERLAADLGIADAVEFAGYIDDHEEVMKLVRSSGVGVAVYDPAIAAFSYYADPGKIRNYLAAGVPVVVTDVPQSAREVDAAGAGVVVSYDAEAIADGIVSVLEPESHEKRRAAARQLGERHHWPVIFDEALSGDGH